MNDTFTNQISGLLDTSQGFLVSGTNLANFQIGFPFNVRATNMQACIKYTRAGTDSAELNVKFTKFNTVSQMTQDVSTNSCYIRVGSSSATPYTVTVPITYINGTVVPDTAIISLSPSSFNSQASVTPFSTLWVDNVVLNYNNGTFEVLKKSSVVGVYPPVGSDVIRLIDITGKEISQISVHGINQTMSLKTIGAGIYFYEVISADSKVLASGKVSVIQ
jgi:hypothetical protein